MSASPPDRRTIRRCAARVLISLIVMLVFVLFYGRGRASGQNAPGIDQLLDFQDELVLSSYAHRCLPDRRFDDVLRRISARLNPHLQEIYPQYFNVNYYVFAGRMGFNAQTWNRIIIFDSLLLDAMRNLACGIAVYGSTNCDYVHNLANYVAETDKACRAGRLLIDLSNPQNPYGLPTIWGLTPAQRDRADALFEEMLASWIAHEGSHAFLHHTRDRVEAESLMRLYQQRNQISAEEARAYVNGYLTYEMSRQKEREADEYGIRLTLRSGYGINGLVQTFEFAQQIEELNGQSQLTTRTHPTPRERIELARQVARQEANAPR